MSLEISSIQTKVYMRALYKLIEDRQKFWDMMDSIGDGTVRVEGPTEIPERIFFKEE